MSGRCLYKGERRTVKTENTHSPIYADIKISEITSSFWPLSVLFKNKIQEETCLLFLLNNERNEEKVHTNGKEALATTVEYNT